MALNPVERRVAALGSDWADFRDDPTRSALLWQVPESGLRTVEGFVELQKHDTELATGDMFLLFKQPFVHGLQYARALKEALRGQYDASLDELQAQGLPTDWAFTPTATPDTPEGFAEAVGSFGSKYFRSLKHLCIVLWPLNVAHADALCDWVRGLLDVGLPERLRVLLVEPVEHPRYAALAGDPRIQVQPQAIDGLALAHETFAQEGGVGPAAVFRTLMMGVVALLDKAGAEQVKVKALDALQFARRQGWADQEVAIRVLVAGALLKEQRHAEAVQVYQAARGAADQTVMDGHPAGRKLLLQTWFGEAGTHHAAGEPRRAAEAYDQAAEVAQQDGNTILAIEAFRMAGYCLAQAGDADEARLRGQCALQLGGSLAPEARAMTTLPVALVDLMRLDDPERVREMQAIKARLQVELDAVREQGEQQARQLVAQQAPDALEQVEALRQQGADQAIARADAALASCIERAPEPFRHSAAQGQALLGEQWLVANDLALPPLPPTEPAPAQETAA